MECVEVEQTNLSKKKIVENDDEERKHFCKVISAFRFYRLVQLPSLSFDCLQGWLWVGVAG